jgi:hypothetical protein
MKQETLLGILQKKNPLRGWNPTTWRVDMQRWNPEAFCIELRVWDPIRKTYVILPEKEYLGMVDRRKTPTANRTLNQMRGGSLYERQRLHDRLGLLEQEPGL